MLKYLDVEKIGKAEVIVDIIPSGNKEIRPAYPMDPSEAAIHNTGNPRKGANAKMHNTYIHNMASYHPKDTSHVSWHLSVDDKFIYQHIPFDESAWHTGDGNTPTSGNRNAIGIEICENPDMDYDQAEENAVQLTAYLREKFPNIPIKKVKGHIEYSGKYCPRVILNRDGSVDKFRKRVENVKKAPVSNVTDFYSVKKGDTLWGIAKEHNATVKEIKKLNSLKSDTIYPNQKLRLDKVILAVVKPSSTPKVKQAPAVARLVLDGSWGPAVTGELQKHFKTPVTKAISKAPAKSTLIEAMQRFYRSPVTGQITWDGESALIKAMQRYHGTPVTGRVSDVGSLLIKEIQKQLNDGTYPKRK